MSAPDRQAVRKGLARLVAHGAASVWLPESQALIELPAVREKLRQLGPGREEEALVAVLRDAVEQLGTSQHRQLLTIVLALDDAYAGMTARERRERAGQDFRGGTHQVSWGTIRQHHEPRALDELTSLLLSETAEGRVAVRPSPSELDAPPRHVEWHPLVHEQWASERLSFWRLGLASYDAETTVRWVHQVMRAVGVRSWSLHELLGHWDVLIRAWVPTVLTELEKSLQDAFRSGGLTSMDRFDVAEIVSHWPWAHGGTPTIRRPDPAVLERRLTDREIAQLDAVAQSPAPLAARAEKLNLRTLAQPEPGIDFMVSLRLPPIPHTREATAALTEQVSRLLANQERISETSLYRGDGFADYLIFGKARHTEFHEVRRSLLAPLREIPVGLSRPTATTVVLATSGALASEEAMSLTTPKEPDTVEELLDRPEGPRLDVRGSAFLDLSFQGDELDAPPSDRARDALLRTVVAMLNADGGTIVIGALGAGALRDGAPVDDLPRIGNYVVVGIGEEMKHGWDEFQRRLITAYRDAVGPDPSAWIDAKLAYHAARPIAVLTINTPSTHEGWFYVRGRGQRYDFCVRSGAATTVLGGPDADEYKRATLAKRRALAAL
jgi:hypothetical protein